VFVASTNCVSLAMGMLPQGAAPQSSTSWQDVSPGTASCPFPQAAPGKTARQPEAPSGSKPAPQASGGTPAGWQPPASVAVSPIAHEAGVDVQWDEELYRSTQDELDRLDDYAPAIGAGECDAFVEIIEVGAKFARGFTTHPKARFNSGSEHILAWALEQQSGRRLIHGEAVNLGILLMAHIQGSNPERAAEIIRTAKMCFQPEQLGITWPIVEAIVMQLPEFARNVPWHTIVTEFDQRGEDGRRDLASRFAAARDYVQRLG
jgi:hypothetical protein